MMLSILRFCVLLQTGKNKEESLVLVTLGRQECGGEEMGAGVRLSG